MALREEKVVLLIADISGYTEFMLANEKSLEHSHLIIGELIETILGEVQLPLTLAKLEGDAVFLYAVKDEAFAERAEDLGARVLRFFHVFSNKVAELTLSSFCKCGACKNIETLKLKVVVHSGRCAFCEIKREYAEVATNPTKGFHFHTGRTLAALLGYDDEMLQGIPEQSIARLAGTGNPFALGPLHPGECVVELGCGAGMDTLIASRM